MKKVLSVFLSLIIVFTFAPMAMSAANADESTYTQVLDFDNNLVDAVIVAANVDAVKGEVVDYTQVDADYANGNVLKMYGSHWTNYGFAIGDVLKDKKVKSISFTAWAEDNASINYNRVGIGGSGVASINVAGPSLGLKNHISITTAPKTVTYDFSSVSQSLYNEFENAYLVFANETDNSVIYIDDIVITYQKYAAVFTGMTESDYTLYADENGNLSLPEASISEGEFAGWVTEDDADTILPAGSNVILTDDVKFFAVAAERADQPAPEAAPQFESKTSSSVTLVLQSNCQYSKDGIVWQDSNVFNGLTPDTEYSFYSRFKATPVLKASGASPALNVRTAAVYNIEAETAVVRNECTGLLNPNSPNPDTSTGSLVYVTHDASNPAVGHYVTYKFTGLSTGYYQISLFSRNVAGSRSTYEVTAYDETNEAQSAGSINFGDLSTKYGNNSYYCNPSLPNTVAVTSGSSLTLRFTISKAGTGSGSYIDKFVLSKVADFNPVEKHSVIIDGETVAEVDDGAAYALPETTADGFIAYTDGENYFDIGDEITVDADVELSTVAIGKLEMQQGASIRLGKTSGLRFRTVVDADKLAALPETAVVEKGTYIGPRDLIDFDDIRVYGESENFNCIDVKYTSDKYHDNSSNIIAGSIVDIKDKNITRDYIGRGYVKVTLGGITKTIIAQENDNSKSIAYIANAYRNDAGSNYAGLADDLKALVNKWADAYNG